MSKDKHNTLICLMVAIMIILAIVAVGLLYVLATHDCVVVEHGVETKVEDIKQPFTFEDMLDAIEYVESKGIATAIGQNGELGAYQIKQIYLDDYHRITDKPIKESNGYDLRLSRGHSRHMTRTVTQHYAHHDYPDLDVDDIKFIERAARTHQRTADRKNSKTDAYWLKILTRMEEVRK